MSQLFSGHSTAPDCTSNCPFHSLAGSLSGLSQTAVYFAHPLARRSVIGLHFPTSTRKTRYPSTISRLQYSTGSRKQPLISPTNSLVERSERSFHHNFMHKAESYSGLYFPGILTGLRLRLLLRRLFMGVGGGISGPTAVVVEGETAVSAAAPAAGAATAAAAAAASTASGAGAADGTVLGP